MITPTTAPAMIPELIELVAADAEREAVALLGGLLTELPGEPGEGAGGGSED